MPMPRSRFTIGGLMLLVLVVAVVLWGRRVYLARIRPTPAEQRALADYRQATLTREVAEYAIREFAEGIGPKSAYLDLAQAAADLEQLTNRSSRSVGPSGAMPVVPWRGRPPARTGSSRPLDLDPPEDVRARADRLQQRQLQSLRDDAARTRADEATRLHIYQSEQALRLRWSGF